VSAADSGSDSGADEQEPDYRFTLANERTYLAWQRTALGLLAAAVAVVQFAPELRVPGRGELVGLVLTVLATVTAAVGLWRWRQVNRAMRRGTSLPRHPTPAYLAVGLCVIGVLVLVAAVVRMITG
jgi:putative membrane protein